MLDKISKQKLNIIMLVDCSTSMRGERINQVNSALSELKTYLVDLEKENSNVDFYITVITFSTVAYFQHNDRTKLIDDYVPTPIVGGGWSNVHLAYEKLEDILKKESKGGIMPDFGGVAPIILLMTDGHPTKWPLKEEMARLNSIPWFNVALKYGIAIGLDDQKTIDVLKDFVSDNGDVITCFDNNMLKKLIKIIVVTASKVKSSNTNVGAKQGAQGAKIVQQVKAAIAEIDDWEW